MSKRTDAPSRSEISDTVDRKKEAMEQKGVDLEQIASDVQTVRNTLANLEFGGSADGADEVENAINDAETVTVDTFDQEDQELEGIQQESDDHRSDIEDRSGSVESDLGKLSDASGQIETPETIDELVKAKESALREVDFLAEQIERARQAREESERLQNEYGNVVRK